MAAFRLRCIKLAVTIAAFAFPMNTAMADVTARGYPMPAGGFVNTKDVAVGIAQIILKSIFPASEIEQSAPYTATLKDGVWIVQGTLPKGYRGGVQEVWIDKKTGEIIRVIYGK